MYSFNTRLSLCAVIEKQTYMCYHLQEKYSTKKIKQHKIQKQIKATNDLDRGKSQQEFIFQSS